eukprot:1469045-Prymnesium_polylepis.1
MPRPVALRAKTSKSATASSRSRTENHAPFGASKRLAPATPACCCSVFVQQSGTNVTAASW